MRCRHSRCRCALDIGIGLPQVGQGSPATAAIKSAVASTSERVPGTERPYSATCMSGLYDGRFGVFVSWELYT